MNPSKQFLWFAMFSCVVTVAALALCHFNHKESHDRIINQNQSAFQSYRATLASLPSRIDTITARKQDVLLDIIEDSLLNNLPKLPRNHQQALRSYVESAVLAASMELPYYSLIGELEESASSLQIANIQAETKALLELEFNKIQNEYETLALWASILTVVFLIFSFYSMFKTDELLQQGKNGLKELNAIKERGEASVFEFEEKSDKSIQKCQIDFVSFMSNLKETESRRIDGLEMSIKKISQGFEEETQKRIKVVQKYVETTKHTMDEQYARLSASSLDLENRLNTKIAKTDESLKEYVEQMKRIKQQMDVMRTMIETMKS